MGWLRLLSLALLFRRRDTFLGERREWFILRDASFPRAGSVPMACARHG